VILSNPGLRQIGTKSQVSVCGLMGKGIWVRHLPSSIRSVWAM